MTASLPSFLPAEIPSPTVGVWHLGPFPLRGYALAILAGIVLAVWLTQKRLSAKGYRDGIALDVAVWAVPFGILGGRLYHLITSPAAYFGPGGQPLKALEIWNGGLGIWGAVALGLVGAAIGCRKHDISLLTFADAAAPGVLFAQAMGRFGNYFNNEIYGAPTDLPWKLKIYEWNDQLGQAVTDSAGNPIVKGYFHPTFLYESIFCCALAALLLYLSKHGIKGRPLRPGQLLAGYVMGYPVGRIVIENMRSDEANRILGQRVNTWMSLIVFAIGVYLWRRFGQADPPVTPDSEDAESATEPESAPASEPASDSEGTKSDSANDPATASANDSGATDSETSDL